jgi:hypothetical protein
MKTLHNALRAARSTALGGALALSASGCLGAAEDADLEGTVQAAQDRVMVCHRGETITIARPALRAHLAHGDTEGPCEVVEEDAGVEADAGADAGGPL